MREMRVMSRVMFIGRMKHFNVRKFNAATVLGTTVLGTTVLGNPHANCIFFSHKSGIRFASSTSGSETPNRNIETNESWTNIQESTTNAVKAIESAAWQKGIPGQIKPLVNEINELKDRSENSNTETEREILDDEEKTIATQSSLLNNAIQILKNTNTDVPYNRDYDNHVYPRIEEAVKERNKYLAEREGLVPVWQEEIEYEEKRELLEKDESAENQPSNLKEKNTTQDSAEQAESSRKRVSEDSAEQAESSKKRVRENSDEPAESSTSEPGKPEGQSLIKDFADPSTEMADWTGGDD